jgi:hypothetical protein
VLGVCATAWVTLRVDDGVLGRVGATLNGLTRTAGLAALALGGAAVGLLDPRVVFGLSGAAGVVVVLGFLLLARGREGRVVAAARTEGALHAEGAEAPV